MYSTLRVYSIFYEVPPFKTVTYKKKEEKLIMKIYCERYFDFVQKQKTIAWQHIVQLKSFFFVLLFEVYDYNCKRKFFMI